MAYTTLAGILGGTTMDNCLNPAEATIADGTLYEDMPPGTVVVYDSANHVWVKADSATASHKLRRVGVVGYRKRIRASTGAVPLNSDNWDVSEAEDKVAPIIVDGFAVANIVDQNAAVDAMTELIISSTAGALTIRSQEAAEAGETTNASAFRSAVAATAAANIADDDTKAIIALGKKLGHIWGGINP